MGMYTEMVLNCELQDDTPEEVIDILLYLFADREREIPKKLPDHEFFSCSRWKMVGSSSSYYFIPFAVSSMEKHLDNYYVSTRFDLKNYDGEIQKFLDWIMPYIDAYDGNFLGYHRYEEEEKPTLIYYKEAGNP